MDEQQAIEYVIRELGRHSQRNEVIRRLCEYGGMNWSQADKFIHKVESEHKQKIAVRQTPLIAAIGGITLLAGLVITINVILRTIQGEIIFLLSIPIPYSGNIAYFVTGMAMITGGLRGTWNVLRNLWDS